MIPPYTETKLFFDKYLTAVTSATQVDGYSSNFYAPKNLLCCELLQSNNWSKLGINVNLILNFLSLYERFSLGRLPKFLKAIKTIVVYDYTQNSTLVIRF